jgi:DNA-directed RNA polymerase specialized sigma24 family protein
VEELTYQEAADVLDIPTGTIMSRLFRARKHLQTRLGPMAEAEGFGAKEDQES